MSIITNATSDISTMSWRMAKHSFRNPTTLISAFLLPVITLLLFTYGFGGALDTHGVKYIDFATPGVLLLIAVTSASTVAVAVSTDVKEGIVDRFRAMPILRSSVLVSHVVANTLRTLVAAVLVVLVALAIGFRPTAGVVEWAATIGMVVLLLLAVSWLAIALGLAAGNPEGAANSTIGLLLLPYVSNAFVPTDTMPGWLQTFTTHQPMTPIGHTLRSLLIGGPIGNDGIVSVAWCVGIMAVGALWARRGFARSH